MARPNRECALCVFGDSWRLAPALETVPWLLSRSANQNIRDGSGWAPLHSTATYGHAKVSRFLLQYKADNKTPLHLASEWGRARVVWVLLRHGVTGADTTNTRDNSCSTPLLRALQYGRLVEVARVLVVRGANIHAEDDEGGNDQAEGFSRTQDWTRFSARHCTLLFNYMTPYCNL
jgi:ankyrin repeat protein